jgi:hypothetical protein
MTETTPNNLPLKKMHPPAGLHPEEEWEAETAGHADLAG